MTFYILCKKHKKGTTVIIKHQSFKTKKLSLYNFCQNLSEFCQDVQAK